MCMKCIYTYTYAKGYIRLYTVSYTISEPEENQRGGITSRDPTQSPASLPGLGKQLNSQLQSWRAQSGTEHDCQSPWECARV